MRHLNSVLLAAFPDLRLDVEDEVAEGDKVLVRLTLRATHRGEFMDIPPTGNDVEVGILDLFRIADGRLEEHWAMIDNLGLRRQLGAILTEEQPKEASTT